MLHLFFQDTNHPFDAWKSVMPIEAAMCFAFSRTMLSTIGISPWISLECRNHFCTSSLTASNFWSIFKWHLFMSIEAAIWFVRSMRCAIIFWTVFRDTPNDFATFDWVAPGWSTESSNFFFSLIERPFTIVSVVDPRQMIRLPFIVFVLVSISQSGASIQRDALIGRRQLQVVRHIPIQNAPNWAKAC